MLHGSEPLAVATIRAGGGLTIASGGQLWGKNGGRWDVDLGAGPFVQNGSLDLTTDGTAGAFDLVAGAISVTSPVAANGRVRAAFGSSVTLRGASVDIRSPIRTDSGSDGAGGPIWIDSGGALAVDANLDASGGWLDGGDITLRALGTVHQVSGTWNAAGGGDAGSGGTIYAWGVGGVTVDGAIDAHGASGTYGSGGYGGVVALSSPSGHVVVNGGIDVHAPGDGAAGGVLLVADDGDVVVTRAVNADGASAYATGGWVSAFAGAAFELTATLSLAGGEGGGGWLYVGAGDAVVEGDVIAHGGGNGGDGGTIQLVVDTLDLSSHLDARADNTGSDGSILLDACDLWVEPTGWLDNDRPGGDNQLIARESASLEGDFQADVSVTLTYRRGVPRIGPTASFSPPLTEILDPGLRSCVCPLGDEDGDQVCDRDDRCPGGDDTIDLDGDGWPDACPLTHTLTPGVAGDWNELHVTGATPGGDVWVVGSLLPGTIFQPRCHGRFGLGLPARGRRFVADADGTVTALVFLPAALAGTTPQSQVLDVGSCRTNGLLETPL